MGRRFILYLVLSLIIVGCTVSTSSDQKTSQTSRTATISGDKSVHSLQQIEEMFTTIRERTNWNMDGDMLWGYFFIDTNPDKLNSLGKQLASMGYTIVEVYPNKDNTFYTLHISKVETHSPQTLFVRDEQFDDLANQFGIGRYDGMDVGPAK